MDLTTIDGRPFALLLMRRTPAGADDWAVFPGIARIQDNVMYVDRSPRPRFEIRPEWFERIRLVEPSERDILQGADYYLPLSVGDVPADEDASDFLRTGLRWPE